MFRMVDGAHRHCEHKILYRIDGPTTTTVRTAVERAAFTYPLDAALPSNLDQLSSKWSLFGFSARGGLFPSAASESPFNALYGLRLDSKTQNTPLTLTLYSSVLCHALGVVFFDLRQQSFSLPLSRLPGSGSTFIYVHAHHMSFSTIFSSTCILFRHIIHRFTLIGIAPLPFHPITKRTTPAHFLLFTLMYPATHLLYLSIVHLLSFFLISFPQVLYLWFS